MIAYLLHSLFVFRATINYKPNFIIIKDIKKQTYIQFIVKSILSDCGIAICRVFSFTKS